MKQPTLVSLLAASSLVSLMACHRETPAAPTVTPTPAATTAAAVHQPVTEAELSTVSADDLAARIARHDNVVVFDVNGRDSYAEHHIPGARWAVYDQVHATDLPSDHATPLVFYCANEHCMACHTAAHQAIALGYTNVSVLPVGIQGWVAAGKPVAAGQPAA